MMYFPASKLATGRWRNVPASSGHLDGFVCYLHPPSFWWWFCTSFAQSSWDRTGWCQGWDVNLCWGICFSDITRGRSWWQWSCYRGHCSFSRSTNANGSRASFWQIRWIVWYHHHGPWTRQLLLHLLRFLQWDLWWSWHSVLVEVPTCGYRIDFPRALCFASLWEGKCWPPYSSQSQGVAADMSSYALWVACLPSCRWKRLDPDGCMGDRWSRREWWWWLGGGLGECQAAEALLRSDLMVTRLRFW